MPIVPQGAVGLVVGGDLQELGMFILTDCHAPGGTADSRHSIISCVIFKSRFYRQFNMDVSKHK